MNQFCIHRRWAVTGILSALVLALLPIQMYAYTSPGKPTGLVNDFAGILTPSQKQELENTLGNFARPAGVQITVVTVPSLGQETIETYAVALFKEWGIGDKIRDNGLLMLVAPNDKQIRIEVGYGLEGVITDIAAATIIRTDIIPLFKTGSYYEGIRAGLTRTMKLIEGDLEAMKALEVDSRNTLPPSQATDYVPLIVFVIILLMLIHPRTRKIVIYMLASGVFRGGGHGGGGGFGGFGGGSSGGGGASGRW